MDATIIHMPLSFSGPGDSQSEGSPNVDVRRSVASTRLSVSSAPERLYSVNNRSSFIESALSIAMFGSLDPILLVPSGIRTTVSTQVLEASSSAPAAPQDTSNGLNAAPSCLSIGYELGSPLEDETRLVAPELQTPMAFEKISASSLLASTRLRRPPIVYDVTFVPSSRSVVDRSTRSAVPPSILNQPATDPPIPAGNWLTLHTDKLPWKIIATASSRHSFSSRSETASADSAAGGSWLSWGHPYSLACATQARAAGTQSRY